MSPYVTNYLLTEIGVFTGKSQTAITITQLIWQGQGLRLPLKTVHSRLISCLLYGFLLYFCRPIIRLKALQGNNALELAN